MNCCDEYGNCNQGRDCPVRKTKCHHPEAAHAATEVGAEDDADAHALIVLAILCFAVGVIAAALLVAVL